MGESIVLIHGLWMHGFVMEPLRQRLQRSHGFVVHNFSYPSVGDGLQPNVERLRAFLRPIDGPQVHLVGHSLGGVMALRALEDAPWAKPGRVVCLGSPLKGSSAGRALADWPGGDWMLGRTIRDAVLDAPMERYDGDRDVGVIAGDVGIGMGVLLNALEKPHDGIVTVEETRLPGIKDHLQMHLSHTALMLSREVADQIASFLREGHFVKADEGVDEPNRDQSAS